MTAETDAAAPEGTGTGAAEMVEAGVSSRATYTLLVNRSGTSRPAARRAASISA
jgi:hypothetical protein